jgi:hypothetical protein
MRAILIDPEKRTVTEIQIEQGAAGDRILLIRNIQAAIGCRSFETGARPLTGSMEAGFDTLYVDAYALIDGNPRHWFQVDADRPVPSSHPVGSRGLVVSVDEAGESRDASISVAELTSRVTFTQRKLRGFDIASAPGLVSVTAKAPIIETK